MKLGNKLKGIRGLLPFDNRWQLIFDRLFFKESSLLVYKIGNVEFLIDHNAGDHNGTRLCLVSDIYTRFLPKMDLDKTISVFDLGANGGGFPLMLLLNGKQFSKLVCVEMNPNTFLRLQYNVARNINGEVALIQGAVCGNRRKFELLLGAGDISDSIYQNASEASISRQNYVIEGYTFDELFRAHFGQGVIDICKMDIEGAEYDVLSTPQHSCLQFCRYLLVELHAARVEQQYRFAEALAAIGFAELPMSNSCIPGEHLYRNEKLN
jgi:FkbM family methyltransferase